MGSFSSCIRVPLLSVAGRSRHILAISLCNAVSLQSCIESLVHAVLSLNDTLGRAL